MIQLFRFSNHIIQIIKKDFNLKELLKGSMLGLIFRFLSIIIGYVLIFVLTRYYGVEGLGFYSTIWTILLILSVVAKLGFDTSAVKLTAIWSAKNEKNKISGLYAQISFILLISGSFIGLFLFLLSKRLSILFFKTADLASAINILAISILPLILLNINSEIHKGMKNISLFSVFQNVGINFVFILMLVYFAGTGAVDYINISEALFLSIFILLIISYITLLKKIPLKNKIKVYSAKRIIRISFPMLLGNSIFLILNWTDIIVLSVLRSESDVGIYNTTLKISALIGLGLMGISSIAMPKFAQLKDDARLLRKFTKQISFLSGLWGIPIFLVIIFGASSLLSLFGDEFIYGKLALQILAIGSLFKVLSGLSIDLLTMTGGEKIAKNILGLSVILNIILNFLFIPFWGINGAALATAISTIFWNAAAAWFVYRKYHFIPFVGWGYYKNIEKRFRKI